MKLCPSSGILSAVEFLPSPNHNQRPDITDISLLVLHNISLPPNDYNNLNISKFFTNTLDFTAHPYFETIKSHKVSPHFYIDRSGKIIQFVATTMRAWHAGKSLFQGRQDCNDFSIGIELAGSDTIPYTSSQYAKLVMLSKVILLTYPKITLDRVVGHSDIAPDRKTDPGPAFDWPYFKKQMME